MATIQGIYIALFGRPADPAGLAFFNEQTNNGADLTAIGDLAATDEYQDRFDGLNNVQIVTKIYQDLFGRDPDAAGLAFFVAALNSGTYNINNVAIAILDGAQGDDAAVVANKIASANLFTAAIDTSIEIGSYVGDDAADAGRAFLAGITADEATVKTAEQAADAVQAIVDAGLEGNTNVSQAAGSDVSVGATVGDAPTTESTNANDTITITGTYTGTGVIDGGLGRDSVTLVTDAGVVTDAGDIVRVERLFVSAVAGGGSIDLSNTAGLQQVWANGSANNLAISGLDLGTTIGLNSDGAGAVSFAFDDATGDSDSADLVIASGVDLTGALSLAEIETVNISVAGPTTLAAVTFADAEEVNLTGTGDITTGAVLLADDATFDASGHVGVLNVTVAAAQDGATIVGGASNDVFNVQATAEGIVLTGGAGNDLFNLNLSNLNDLTDNESILDDVIQITDFSAANDLLDINIGVGTRASLDNIETGNISAATDLEAALDLVAQAADDDGAAYAVFQYKGSTYVYVDSDLADANLVAGDGLVELVGFTGELTASNFTTAI
jgi:hypothetical protein